MKRRPKRSMVKKLIKLSSGVDCEAVGFIHHCSYGSRQQLESELFDKIRATSMSQLASLHIWQYYLIWALDSLGSYDSWRKYESEFLDKGSYSGFRRNIFYYFISNKSGIFNLLQIFWYRERNFSFQKTVFCNLPLGFLGIVHGHCAPQTKQGKKERRAKSSALESTLRSGLYPQVKCD